MLSNPDPPGRIMVVDDDATIVDVVRRYLVRDGHEVECVPDGAAALRLVEQEPPDLVVLDLMLPGMGGLEVCRRLREHWLIPVVMLTALGEETDRVVGFETGADDYVTKPFSPRELALRVRGAAWARGGGLASLPCGTIGDGELRIDLSAHEARLGTALLALTSREYDLLVFLLSHPRQAFSRSGCSSRCGTGHSATPRRSRCMCAGFGRRSSRTRRCRSGSSRYGELVTGMSQWKPDGCG